ncbi:DNA/RNA non-specific endonuclease [Herpetosiphon llansteffanensis]|uniref:DNA/RNA non-specific endonuclease n=1 Tax=Herpetosiphon llansteffanensis TaxID=2094568 RepID=UPI000D7CFA3D|nr:DNA/RNA non-specific endonuclease [Herpetosiphon llansteffanensis]
MKDHRLITLLALFVIIFAGASMVHPLAAKTVSSDNLVLGNPSGAVASSSYPTNYLIQRNQYALSYHRDNGIANWVSWHLDSGDIGSASRSDFQPDSSLPSGWYRVATGDYSGSGYDRGHMTPSGDRTSSASDNQPTFYMTNIIPQAPDNNQGPWVDLETYARELVSAGNELYIITGGAGSRGTIANGKVRIPNSTWKIIVVLSLGSNDLSRVSNNTRVIAINMPNVQGIRDNDWRDYLTTVDALESLTGYNFLSNVSTSIQSVIEARIDGSTTPVPTSVPNPTSAPNPTATPVRTATPPPSTGCSSTRLFFSEYVEGSGSNKALELYNNTGASVSLSGYSIQLYANGATNATSSVNLSGSLANGATYVIANASASSSLLNLANITNGVANFNGNDALVLTYNGAVVDSFGQVGNDPGSSGWGGLTTDRSLRRKANIASGDTNRSDSFSPSSAWDAYSSDTFSGLGSHTVSCQ